MGSQTAEGQLHSGPAASAWRPRAGPGPGESSVCLSLSWGAGKGSQAARLNSTWGPLPRIRRERLGRPGPLTRSLQGPGKAGAGKAGASHKRLLHPQAPGQKGPALRPLTWGVLRPSPASRLPAVDVSPCLWVGRSPPRGFSEPPRPDAEHCQPSRGSREQEGTADTPARRTSSEDRSSSPSRGPTRG